MIISLQIIIIYKPQKDNSKTYHFSFSFLAAAKSISLTIFFNKFQESIFKVIPFFVGSHLSSFSKYSLMFILTDPLNLLTDILLDFVNAQYSYPSSLICFYGLESSDDYSSSLTLSEHSSFIFFCSFFYIKLSFFDIPILNY